MIALQHILATIVLKTNTRQHTRPVHLVSMIAFDAFEPLHLIVMDRYERTKELHVHIRLVHTCFLEILYERDCSRKVAAHVVVNVAGEVNSGILKMLNNLFPCQASRAEKW